MDDKFFKTLTPEEIVEYKQWARDNFKVDELINQAWHPVLRAECQLMIDEQFKSEPASGHERELEQIEMAELYLLNLKLAAFSWGSMKQIEKFNELLNKCSIDGEGEFPDEVDKWWLKATNFEIVQDAYAYFLTRKQT